MSGAGAEHGPFVASDYQQHLVPLIFQPYVDDVLDPILTRPTTSVLEIAAGTGVLTRRLAERLPSSTRIVASDISPTMLDLARQLGTLRPVTFGVADAGALPFADASFDAVLCQFGVMFFPDKVAAFGEVRRVLRPGGIFRYSAWDRVQANEFVQTIMDSLAELWPDDPPTFLTRLPHGYHDRAEMVEDLVAAGFHRSGIVVDVVSKTCHAASAYDAAIAFCLGTPLRSELEARVDGPLEPVLMHVTRALERQFGAGPISGLIQAQLVSASE